VYRSLGHPLNAGEAVNALTRQLDTVYRQVAKNFSDNQAVSLDFSGKRTKLTIAHLSGLDESPTLKSLAERVSGLLPVVDLTELLLEINAHTGFADEFTHASEAGARMEGLTVSICAVLLAEACNIGLEPFIRPNIPALTRHRLNWTRQNYLRAETLVSANTRLVDYQSTLPLAQKWGGGEVTSADGMRFIAPVRTVHAGPNRKYFGSSRGITWYNMQAALDHLRNEGETINEEDEVRLSPLRHAHINMQGHYTFTLAEQVTKGQLRPLKQAEETDEWPL